MPRVYYEYMYFGTVYRSSCFMRLAAVAAYQVTTVQCTRNVPQLRRYDNRFV